MDECLQIVRRLLTGKPVDQHGEFFTLKQARIVPAPAQPVPIVVGGRSDAAVRRAGRLGDGWFGLWVSARRYAQAAEEVAQAGQDAGRNVNRWVNALNVWCGVGPTATDARRHVATAMQDFYRLPYERFEKWSPAGPAERLAEFLVPYAQAGCSVLNLIIQGASAEAEVEAAGKIRRLVVEATS